MDGASVVAVVGELEPAGMPQHVGMHEEREFRSHAHPGNHALISSYGQRRATLRDEDVWGRGFAQELAQRAAFPRRYRMHAWHPRSWPCVHASAPWLGRCRPSAVPPAPRPRRFRHRVGGGSADPERSQSVIVAPHDPKGRIGTMGQLEPTPEEGRHR